MPYCFDFTFNFYIWLMSLRKKTTRRRKEIERRGKMRQESRVVPPVGAACGVCPTRGGLWVCLAGGQGDGSVVTAQSWGPGPWFASSGDEVGAKVLSGSSLPLPPCVYSLDSCASLSPCRQAVRGAQQDRVGAPGPPEGEMMAGKPPEALGAGVLLHRRL